MARKRTPQAIQRRIEKGQRQRAEALADERAEVLREQLLKKAAEKAAAEKAEALAKAEAEEAAAKEEQTQFAENETGADSPAQPYTAERIQELFKAKEEAERLAKWFDEQISEAVNRDF